MVILSITFTGPHILFVNGDSLRAMGPVTLKLPLLDDDFGPFAIDCQREDDVYHALSLSQPKTYIRLQL